MVSFLLSEWWQTKRRAYRHGWRVHIGALSALADGLRSENQNLALAL